MFALRRQAILVPAFALLLLALHAGSCGFLAGGRNLLDPAGPAYVDTACVDAATPGSIDVVTYNIRFGRRIDAALDVLRRAAEDEVEILLLQEMHSAGVRAIACSLGYNYVFYPAVIHGRHDREFGNAVLAREPILSHEKIILPHLDPNGLQRIAVYARVKLRGRQIGIYSVHLGTRISSASRGDQVDRILRHAGRVPVSAVIVGGDFNTFSQSGLEAVLDRFTRSGYVHAVGRFDWTYGFEWLGVTWKRYLLDHLFVSGLPVIDVRRIGSETEASDHLPVRVRLRLTPDSAPARS